MSVKYTCSFVSYPGEICMRNCTRPKGCCFHYKSLEHVPCTDCGKPTRSDSGRCRHHIRGYYVSKHFQKHLKKKRIL